MAVSGDTKLGIDTNIDRLAQVGYPGKAITDRNASLGDRVTVEPFAIVYRGATIGADSYVSQGASIFPGVVTGTKFFAGNGASIRECVTIDNDVRVGSNSIVLPFAKLEDDVRIHSLVVVAEYSQIRRGAWLGPGVLMLNTKYPKSNAQDKDRTDREDAPAIGQYAIIGGGAILNPGVTIGHYSIVASGALMPPGTQVPAFSLVLVKSGRVVQQHLAERPDILAKYHCIRKALNQYKDKEKALK